MYISRITEEEVLKLRSLFIKDYRNRRFTVAESMTRITEEEVLKLRSLCIEDYRSRRFKVAESIYQGLQK